MKKERWIPASRKPNSIRDVILLCRDRDVVRQFVGWWSDESNSNKWIVARWTECVLPVTHWRELPKPPRVKKGKA